MAAKPRTTTRRDGKAGRFYSVDGAVSPLTGTSEFPSVTSILQVLSRPALVAWSANTEREACVEAAADLYADLAKTPPLPRAAFVLTFQNRLSTVKAYRREMENALDIGSQAHKLVEHGIRKALGQVVGPEPKVRDEALLAYMAFQDWCQEHSVQALRIEQQVYHPRLGYAGTLDLVARINGELAIVDVKTAKAIYWEYELQVAAYAAALAAMGHETVTKGYILRLPKNIESDCRFEVVSVRPFDELMPVFESLTHVWLAWWKEEQRSRAAWEKKRAGQVPAGEAPVAVQAGVEAF